MTRVIVGTNFAYVKTNPGATNIEGTIFLICDDCRQAYPEPPYYTFPIEDCRGGITVVFMEPHTNCTGNLCPTCADGLMPDDPSDPR